MRQKKLFDGMSVPAIWQGGGIAELNVREQTRLWTDGVRFGCNAIDTAERYGDGLSETIVGEVIRNVGREKVFVATKVSPEHASKDELIRACERSLKRLGTDYIDLYQVHWSNPTVSLADVMNTFLQLRSEGKIRYIGVCNLTMEEIDFCNYTLNGELATVQVEYNVSNRLCENEIIPYCEANKIVVLGYSPLKSNANNVLRVLRPLVKKYGYLPTQLILNWLTTRDVCALPATTNQTHLIHNAQSTEFTLSSEDIQYISESFVQTVPVKIQPSDISCENSKSGVEGNLPAYKTRDEAIENRFNLLPAPIELSKEVYRTRTLQKPVFVRKTGDSKYELVSGSVRYWAWVLAFGEHTDVECIII